MVRVAVCFLVGLAACATDGVECGSCVSAEAVYAPGNLEPVDDALPFTPRFEAWADGADKRRWLVLPAGAQVDTSDGDHWVLPIGAKLIKEFAIDGQRVETRVVETIAHTGDFEADHRLAAYAWRADGTDADLVPDDGLPNVLGTPHDIPSRAECLECHHSAIDGALGLTAVQHVADAHLDERLTAPAPAFDVPDPALGFLHANCGHCHATEGECPPPLLRLHVAGDFDAYTTAVGVPLAGWPTHPDDITLRIAPGDPDHSAIVFRASHRGSVDQMPPIATEVAPDVTVLRAWIAAM